MENILDLFFRLDLEIKDFSGVATILIKIKRKKPCKSKTKS
jgi:hypothetical protein